jgi:multiple sugar transport system substrate-binding protein
VDSLPDTEYRSQKPGPAGRPGRVRGGTGPCAARCSAWRPPPRSRRSRARRRRRPRSRSGATGPAKNFEAEHPDAKVEITWYQKNPLYAALKTALRAGEAPDVFYSEPNQVEYIENGFLLPLDDYIDWDNVEPWARDVWTFGDKTYGLPLETFTVELYYDRDKMAELGIELPEDGQVDQAAFKDIVAKAAEAGITPIVQGVGDRPYPGAYLTHELLLKKLGKEDYGKLLNGELSFEDPRVQEVFSYVGELVELGAYPESFTTLKLGESHYYFHTNPGGLMFPMGSWYTSRAFNPPDKGGQPEDFPLGIMQVPVPDDAACPNCKTTAVGGSFSVNADSEHPELAAALVNEMATLEMGNLWLSTILVQTGVKTDPSQITGEYAPYFQELGARNAEVDYFVGIPQHHMRGQCQETFEQVMNTAFPAGLMEVEEALSMMDQACHQS